MYITNIDEYKSIGTLWIAFYVNAKNVIYFDSLIFEYIPKEMGNINIVTNVFRIQVYDSIMCRYFCQKVKVY